MCCVVCVCVCNINEKSAKFACSQHLFFFCFCHVISTIHTSTYKHRIYECIGILIDTIPNATCFIMQSYQNLFFQNSHKYIEPKTHIQNYKRHFTDLWLCIRLYESRHKHAFFLLQTLRIGVNGLCDIAICRRIQIDEQKSFSLHMQAHETNNI